MSQFLFSNYGSRRPTQLVGQRFGMGLHPEDLLGPICIPQYTHHHHNPMLGSPGYYRPWRLPSDDNGSTIKYDKDKFQVTLDVQQFSPEELLVKVVDNCVIVEGKHEEKADDHGYIARQFQRRYVLPKNHDSQKVETKLSSDGVLTITAPIMDRSESQERSVQIIHTGTPHKAIKADSETKEADNK